MSPTLSCTLLLAAAGALQAAFALPVPYFQQWRWEHMWIAQATTSNLLFPALFALFLPPRFWFAAASLPASHYWICGALGLLWGVGGIAYGLTLARLGISFAYSFVFGVTTLTGALLPVFLRTVGGPLHPGFFSAGLALSVASVGWIAWLRRSCVSVNPMPLPFHSPPYSAAVWIALFAGVFSAGYGLAFTAGFPAVSSLMRQGIAPESAAWIVALPVYAGSAAAAFAVALPCAVRSGSLREIVTNQPAHNWLLALFMGVSGTGGVVLYNTGSSISGHLEPNVSFGVFMTFFVASGNLMGLAAGEFRSASARTRITLALSILVLIAAAWLLNVR